MFSLKRWVVVAVVGAILGGLGTVAEAASPKATAQRLASRGDSSVSGRSLPRKADTNFSGIWRGEFRLALNTCGAVAQRIPLEHLVQMSGNRVRIVTREGSTYIGTSRDGGKRLETSAVGRINGVEVRSAIVYKSLRRDRGRRVANVGLAFATRDARGRSCTFGYGAVGIAN